MNNPGLKLGEIITGLEEMNPDHPVCTDGPRALPSGELCSYRGYYEDLAILAGGRAHGPIPASQLIKSLKAAVGTTYTGYKGGSYTMGPTRLWEWIKYCW